MRRAYLVAVGLCALLACSAAQAQATYQTTAPQPVASVGADGRTYPSASLAFKLELFALPISVFGGSGSDLPQFSYPALLEVALDISSRFSLYVGLGTYISYSKVEVEDIEEKVNYGIFLLQGGLRVNLMEPRPEHAHLYLGADVTGALAFATNELDGEEDDDAQDAVKEEADHLMWGVGLGIEYLVSSEFGIGSELGFRWMFNNLEDTDPGGDYDKYYVGHFHTYFGLRMAYHF
jgi:hypothetical protein